jgi:hypothetical protein
MAREHDRTLAWRKSGGRALVIAGMATSCRSSSTKCDIQCPAGTLVDETGCACIQAGPVCDGGGASEVQDGGPVLGTCCPAIALRSSARATPTGTCVGSQPCFVAAFQVCPGVPSSAVSGPLDEYTCGCDGATWQCSIVSQGSGVCPPMDSGGE